MDLDPKKQIPDFAIREASLHPNGWVYEIEGHYSPDEFVPFEAIVGWWKVGSEGKIVGDFCPNPNYKPKNERS